MNLLLRKILLILLFGMFLFPHIQQQFEIISIQPLKGSFVAALDTTLSPSGWFSGKYQYKKEKYANENFGFRTWLVKLRNQIDFSFFAKVNAPEFIMGKEGCIYAKEHLDAHTGKDFIGEDSIAQRMRRAKFIQDTLTKMGKTFIFIFAPGKASFYPEYFPEQYSNAQNKKSNYFCHLRRAEELNLNYIDFNNYFVKDRGVSKYSLFPFQLGTHWSEYGMCLVMDSLVKYIEQHRGIDMPDFFWKDIEIANARNKDIDITPPLNLLWFSNEDKMAYPRLKVQSGKGKTKPKVLAIGDSFYATLYNKGFTKAFASTHLWYYNKSLQDINPTRNITVEEEITNNDIVIIMATEANLKNVSWGFIDDAYNLFAKGEHPYYDVLTSKIKGTMEYIRTDAKWIKAIQEKADKNGLSLDSMLYLDSKWMVEEDAKKNKNPF